jgi:orotate phosphoribosyltransferase
MSQRTRLLELLVERSLSLGEFTLASGARSSYYIDARRTTMSAEGQFLVGTVALEALRREGISPAWVGGLTMGADPISYCIAHRSWMEGTPCDAFSVRKQAKEHGSGRRIEGGLPADAQVVVIEDTLTSGRSALEAVEAVREHGARILAVLTLVDREAGGGERIHQAGLPLIRLFTASEILEAAGADVSPPA